MVAGPTYQAALELKDEDIEREHFHATSQHIPRQAISAWWWLIPPVMIILARRRDKQYRQDFMKALPAEDIESLISYFDKATGWLLVGGGGLLLAVSETYKLTRHFEWPLIYFWIAVLGCGIICLANTIYRVSRSQKVIDKQT